MFFVSFFKFPINTYLFNTYTNCQKHDMQLSFYYYFLVGRQCSVKVKNIAKELLQNIECSGTESFNDCIYSSDMGSDTDEPLESFSYSEIAENAFKILSEPNKACDTGLEHQHNTALEEVLQEPVQSASFSSYSNSPFLTSSPSMIENRSIKLNKTKKNHYKVNDHNMFVSCVISQDNINFGTEKKPVDVMLLSEKSEKFIENTNSKNDVGINFKKHDYQPMNQTFCINKHFIDPEAVTGYPRHRPENKHLPYQLLCKQNFLKPTELEAQSSIQTSPAVSVVPLPGSPMLKHLARWRREPSTESTSTKRSEGVSSVVCLFKVF